MGIERRRHERFEVRLQVQFLDAKSFVEQYAYNISQGGLFVASTEFEPGQELTTQLKLPGFGTWEIRCRVAHVTPVSEAGDRVPGAGLQITEAPEDFEGALRAYLRVLNQRKGTTVLVDQEYDFSSLLERAGYRLEEAPEPSALRGRIDAADGPIGVIATAPQADELRAVLAATNKEGLLIEVLPTASFDSVLNALDRRIAAKEGGATEPSAGSPFETHPPGR
jgi:uncharacterized protein (TIGR02266 family)